jgi:serpin B
MTAEMEYWHDEKLEVSNVRLPYGTDKRFRMVVLLPDEKQPVETVRDALSPAVWDRWAPKYESMTVSFGMPKLKLRNQYDLLPLFEDPGGIPEGSYGRLVDPIYEDTHVDYARQDTFLEIDEQGTKAAAVTVIGTGGLAGGVSGVPFTVDRPYLLALEDSKTGSILFTAVIRTPEGDE